MITARRHFRACVELAASTASAGSRSPTCRWPRSPRLAQASSSARCRKRPRAIEAASRVGHQRAEIDRAPRRLHVPGRARRTSPRPARAPSGLLRSRASSARGASRPKGSAFVAAVEARARAPRRGRRAGQGGARDQPRDRHGLHRPRAARLLALYTDDADERRAALEEGEALLAAGSVSHNYSSFYPAAIEAALAPGLGRRRALRRGAGGLHPRRAAAVGRLPHRARPGARRLGPGRARRHGAERLRALRAHAERAGLRHALAALEAALGASGPKTLGVGLRRA